MTRFLLVQTIIQNPQTRSLVKKAFVSTGHRVVESDGYAQAQLLLANGLDPDLLLVDCMPAASLASDQYREMLKCVPAGRTWLVTGIGEQVPFREGIEFGIRHFLDMPVPPDVLKAIVSELNHTDICSENDGEVASFAAGALAPQRNKPTDSRSLPFIEELGEGSFFLAATPTMLEIHRQVKLIADTDVNVLILGESGTGKEFIARLIHQKSQRSDKKFLKVNCAALPADLLESELFGHVQGAFTGAIKDRPGKFEQANGGTLLLDEIGEIDVQLQAKLLHVLEDGHFARLGAQQHTKVDVRVLAATNVQMERALFDKTFREDLFYRLSVFTITVPPLRERREEIPYLIDEMIRRAPAGMKNGGATWFPARLLDVALLYHWPGNLRELRNFVTRTIIMRDPDAALRQLETRITPTREQRELPGSVDELSSGAGMKSIVRDVKERTEAKMIQAALDVSGWNRRHAARALNISYRALLYKIQQHRLTPRGGGNFREVSL
ncbi:MAG: sigma-54 dependent transcriptional regulator [Candidatus Sulfotelmatobacter sp.]